MLITKLACQVTGKEKEINPQNATIIGLGKVIGQEYFNIKCRCIDIDESLDVAYIVEEIRSNSFLYHIAYRNSQRYIEVLNEVDISEHPKQIKEIKTKGIFVITGGTGGIGLQMALYLAQKNKVKLCLISRTPPLKKAPV